MYHFMRYYCLIKRVKKIQYVELMLVKYRYITCFIIAMSVVCQNKFQINNMPDLDCSSPQCWMVFCDKGTR